MNNDSKLMRLSLAGGTYLHLEWPASILLEDLEIIEEALSLQLGSVRRTIQRRKATEQAEQGPAIAQAAPQGKEGGGS